MRKNQGISRRILFIYIFNKKYISFITEIDSLFYNYIFKNVWFIIFKNCSSSSFRGELENPEKKIQKYS